VDELADPATVRHIRKIALATFTRKAGTDSRHFDVAPDARQTLELQHNWDGLLQTHGV